jgi:redox-sensitive bicupin YhaK (pirin superfamily)
MPAQTPGKIFLADQRGRSETHDFRRFATLNFGDFYHEHKQPLGRLLAVNEETLAGGSTLTLPVPEAVHLVLLPITGTVEVLLPSQVLVVEVEQVQVLTLPAGSTLQLRNPYSGDLISLLHLWVRADEPASIVGPAAQFSFEALSNRLAPLLPATAHLPFALSLGRFAGRHEATYELPPGRLFFGFVLAGAFEAEGRLLHEKDGLALWDVHTPIEIEALSHDALLLVLEVAS